MYGEIHPSQRIMIFLPFLGRDMCVPSSDMYPLLVVEPVIFLFHRSLFSAMFIPHEYCTPLHAGGCRGHLSPLWGFGGEAPEGKFSL
jgi:hypothetical protein